MTNISEHVAQLLSEEWKSLPISVDERQFKHFELLPVYLRDVIWEQVQERFRSQIHTTNAHWVPWDEASVRSKWETFITAAMECLVVPREELIEIGQDFVQRWIPILVHPNQELVEFLYGDSIELDAQELEKRCEGLLFFPELKRLLPRYLERKELHVLSKVRASQIIQQLLTKLTESFEWGRWEQELETLYQLCMSVELPKQLLVEYFDDRSKHEWVLKLKGDGDLRVNEVIDLLKRKTLTEPEPEQVTDDEEEDSLFNRPFLEPEVTEELVEETTEESAEVETEEFSQIETEESAEVETIELEEESDEEQTPSIVFVAEEEDDEEDELHPDSLASMFMQNATTSEEETSSTDSLLESDSVFDGSGESEEHPLFETTENSFFEDDTESSSTTLDSFFEEQESEDDAEAAPSPEPSYDAEDGLVKALKKNQKKYIKKLFGGSEADYLEVLQTLEGKFVWKNVIKCLQTEIIPDYEIDMTSKIMVQFTDELQKYFTD